MSDKKYVLTFNDGLVIPDFEWTIMGWFNRKFPPSGIHSGQLNSLRYTRDAIAEGGIELAEGLVIEGELQFVAINRAIMQGPKHVASAQSHNMAKRIARALNRHKINERGY